MTKQKSVIGQLFETIVNLGRAGAKAAEPMPVTSVEVAPVLPDPFDFEDVRIPKIARADVVSILALIETIEARAVKSDTCKDMMFDIRQMKNKHLPDVLRSYIDMPEIGRQAIFARTGHSASYLLKDGLAKMMEQLRRLEYLQAQGDIDQFTQNMTFIGQRYSDPHGESPISSLD